MFGVPMRERLTRTVETVAILRLAWTGERFSHRGEVFELDRVRVTPPPAQPGGPPILLGGYVDAALRRAGELGDGHITDADDLVHVRKAVSLMEEGARDAGRDPAAMHLALMANAFVADEHAWEIAAPGVMHQLGAYEAWDRGSRHAGARFARCSGHRRARRAPFDRGRHGRRRRTRARADRAVARREGRGRSDRATPLPRHGVRRCRPSRLALRRPGAPRAPRRRPALVGQRDPAAVAALESAGRGVDDAVAMQPAHGIDRGVRGECRSHGRGRRTCGASGRAVPRAPRLGPAASTPRTSVGAGSTAGRRAPMRRTRTRGAADRRRSGASAGTPLGRDPSPPGSTPTGGGGRAMPRRPRRGRGPTPRRLPTRGRRAPTTRRTFVSIAATGSPNPRLATAAAV